MKVKLSYHTHTELCKHATGYVLDFAKYAHDKGFEILGFTDHIPFYDKRMSHCRMSMEEMEQYLNDIEEAKKLYPNMKIYSGFEAEYYKEDEEFYKEILKRVDYLNLGQHAIKLDGEYVFIERLEDPKYLRQYVIELIEGMKSGYFSFVNHPDLFALRKESWDEECDEYTHMIAKAALEYNLPLELNAQGLRRRNRFGNRKHPYPMIEFWKIIAKDYPDIKVLISSDAHSPEVLDDEAVNECLKMAEELSLNVIKYVELKNVMKGR